MTGNNNEVIKPFSDMTMEEKDKTIDDFQKELIRQRIMSYRDPKRDIYVKENGRAYIDRA